jgi:hypothetical protein
MLIPRLVAFDHDGKAICAGTPASLHDRTKVMLLPSAHYDFIDYDVNGKTENEILHEVSQIAGAPNL